MATTETEEYDAITAACLAADLLGDVPFKRLEWDDWLSGYGGVSWVRWGPDDDRRYVRFSGYVTEAEIERAVSAALAHGAIE